METDEAIYDRLRRERRGCYATLIPRHPEWIDHGDGNHECAVCGYTFHVEVVPFGEEEGDERT